MNMITGGSGVPVLANYNRFKWNIPAIEADIRHAMAVEVCEHIYCSITTVATITLSS
jgi:hypothetical protein